MQAIIEESEDRERIVLWVGNVAVEFHGTDANEVGKWLCDRSRYRVSMGDGDARRTRPTVLDLREGTTVTGAGEGRSLCVADC